MSPLTAKRLHSVVTYNKRTGEFYWKWRPNLPKRCRHSIAHSKQAGSIMPNGYRYIATDGKSYLASRLAFFYVKGKWPAGDVDHKNRKKLKNNWTNLRIGTRSNNMANSKMFSTNTSGYKGVYWVKEKQKWKACIMVDYEAIHLGYFSNKKDAHLAYKLRAKQVHGAFARNK